MEESLQDNSATSYFRGQYSFRTLNGTMAIIVSLLVSAGFGLLAVRFLWRSERRSFETMVGSGFGLSALLFGMLGLYTLLSWVANRQIEVEINAEGIKKCNRFWAWKEIRSFGGLRYLNGVCLQITTRWRTVSLHTTPLLTDQQFTELAHQLTRCIAVQNANVDVAMYPREASDTA